jgi:hypothetical protein
MRTKIVVLLLLVVAGLWYYFRPEHVEPNTPAISLKSDETAKVIVDNGRLVIVDKDKHTVIDNPRRTDVVIKKDGSVVIKNRKFGFICEPGVGLAIMPQPGATLDIQWCYFKSLGVVSGLGYEFGRPAKLGLKAYIGVSYDLPLKFTRNTAIYVGVTHRKDVIAGLRVRF